MWSEVVALAARQHRVVARWQLLAAGASPDLIRSWLRRGLLHRVHRGVYAVGLPGLDRRGRWMAATLACGPAAASSHRAGAVLLGVRSGDARPEVTTVGGTRPGPPGVVVHRTREPPPLVAVDGIPCTSLGRTLVDLATVVPPDQVRSAVRRAEREQLHVDWSHAVGRPGWSVLRAALPAA